MNDNVDVQKQVDELQKTINEMRLEKQIPNNSDVGLFPSLKDHRTKIMGWITSLAPALVALGYAQEVEFVIKLVDEFLFQLLALQGSLGAAVQYFRNKANK